MSPAPLKDKGASPPEKTGWIPPWRAAEIVGVSIPTIKRWAAAGIIAWTQLGNRYYIEESVLRAKVPWLRANIGKRKGVDGEAGNMQDLPKADNCNEG